MDGEGGGEVSTKLMVNVNFLAVLLTLEKEMSTDSLILIMVS